MIRIDRRDFVLSSAIATLAFLSGCAPSQNFSDEQAEELVRRSYQYVAMYNVNNKFAMDASNPMGTGGWNRVKATTSLADHTMRMIARPNNDTPYVAALLDLRSEPVILDLPAFDSKYVSLMVTGYDHYVNIPLTTRLGDFEEPVSVLFYTERTEGYNGDPVEGVDRVIEMTGDFVSAVLRVMPHAKEPERLERNFSAMRSVTVRTLSEYLGGAQVAPSPPDFPDYGLTDFDIFENNLLEVMQFVFNHTTFDTDDPLDQAILALYEPLGVEPGRTYDPTTVMALDGARLRATAERVAQVQFGLMTDLDFQATILTQVFRPKGAMTLDALLAQSVIGPIGQPAAEAVYPTVRTTDGAPMSAERDYIIRIDSEDMPPAQAFWSLTLYDLDNGFFLPNDRKKYSVGENAGMRLDEDGGITVYIAAERPDGVPLENWLPMERGAYEIDVTLRLYNPDLDRYSSWTPPMAEAVGA